MRFIFDLDGTVIDSSHRQARRSTTGDGWIPLATSCATDCFVAGKMQTAILDGFDVWICTSRVMGKGDFAFLRMQGLLPNGGPVIHRMGEGDARPCGELKLAKLRGMAASMGVNWVQFAHDSIMFDDSIDVQNTMRGAGLRVIDPVQFNSYIARKIA